MKERDKKKLIEQFEELYPNPRSELNFKGKYQLVVSVILSAQCTDKKVNEVTPSLFKEFPNFKSLAEAELSELEKILRPINYYKTKSANLIKMGRLVIDEFSGRLPQKFEDLIKLPGVGRKTANVVQSELGTAHTFPVDTHVFRVSHKLGLSSGKNTDHTEEELKEQFESELWRPMHHWLIFHGRRVCKAQRPLCSECTINSLCPSRED